MQALVDHHRQLFIYLFTYLLSEKFLLCFFRQGCRHRKRHVTIVEFGRLGLRGKEIYVWLSNHVSQ